MLSPPDQTSNTNNSRYHLNDVNQPGNWINGVRYDEDSFGGTQFIIGNRIVGNRVVGSNYGGRGSATAFTTGQWHLGEDFGSPGRVDGRGKSPPASSSGEESDERPDAESEHESSDDNLSDQHAAADGIGREGQKEVISRASRHTDEVFSEVLSFATRLFDEDPTASGRRRTRRYDQSSSLLESLARLRQSFEIEREARSRFEFGVHGDKGTA
ncbi:hypothetical protein IAR50_000874 [Cryptococcus sp. DSM 104548]